MQTEQLSHIALFEDISKDDLPSLLTCLGARILTAKKGEVILREGEKAQDIGVLLSGKVNLIRTDYYGNQSILMNLSQGQLFAESFACAMAETLPVTVAAIEDCEYMLIDCMRLMTSCTNACGFHSRIIFNLLKIVARKNISLYRKNMLTAKRTTREKLLSYLMLRAENSKSNIFTIPFDRQGLADYLNVDRSGLSAELGKLKKEGVLDFHKNSFRLLNSAKDPS